MKTQKRMQKRTGKRTRKTLVWMHCLLAVLFSSTPVYAAVGDSAISAPLGALLSLVADFITGIGAIVTLFGIFEFGNAQQTQDGSAKTYALQRIGGGLIMVVAPQLLQLFVS